MRLHLYFARKFALTLLAVTMVFVLILTLLDVVDQIRRFEIGTINVGQATKLAALNVPAGLYGILPLIVILSTLALFLNLARTSELVVTRSSGRSALRALGAPLLTAFGIGVLCVSVLNPIVAATLKEYERLSDEYRHGTRNVLSISREGLWLRQGGPEGQMVIRAARANLDGTRLSDVTFLAFAPKAGPIWRIEAEAAELTKGAWEITGAKRWAFDVPNPEAAATLHPHLTLPSDLTRDRIRDSFGTPRAIPIWQLPDFIASLKRAGFSARQHQVWLQMELALPALFVSMVMIGAAFTMRHTRFGRTGVMVLGALILGLALFFLRDFAQILGENGQIPVALAAWSPPVIGIMIALALILHMEEG